MKESEAEPKCIEAETTAKVSQPKNTPTEADLVVLRSSDTHPNALESNEKVAFDLKKEGEENSLLMDELIARNLQEELQFLESLDKPKDPSLSEAELLEPVPGLLRVLLFFFSFFLLFVFP
jgi:hypothetical protein